MPSTNKSIMDYSSNLFKDIYETFYSLEKMKNFLERIIEIYPKNFEFVKEDIKKINNKPYDYYDLLFIFEKIVNDIAKIPEWKNLFYLLEKIEEMNDFINEKEDDMDYHGQLIEEKEEEILSLENELNNKDEDEDEDDEDLDILDIIEGEIEELQGEILEEEEIISELENDIMECELDIEKIEEEYTHLLQLMLFSQ